MRPALPARSRRARPAAVCVAVVLALAGCSGSTVGGAPSVSSSATEGGVNDADRHFVTELGPHHDQAVEMSSMLLAKKSGVDPEVRALAREITAASQDELDAMRNLRTAWGPDGHGGEVAGPGHHGGVDGLMTEEQMRQLDQRDGPAAQRLYLDGMLAHHHGAAAIAEAEVRNGRDPGAVAVARQVLSRQHAQIAILQNLQKLHLNG